MSAMMITLPGRKLGDKEQVFTHKDDDGKLRTFPTQYMNEIAQEYGGHCDDIIMAELPVYKHVADHIRAKMGIEQPRLDRLVSPWLEKPLIGIFWQDNKTMTIVDGNHRMVKLYETGAKTMRVYIFKYPFWEQLLLPLSEETQLGVLSNNSGIIEHESSQGAACQKKI